MKKNTRQPSKSASETKTHKSWIQKSPIHGYIIEDSSDVENVTSRSFDNMHDALAFARA